MDNNMNIQDVYKELNSLAPAGAFISVTMELLSSSGSVTPETECRIYMAAKGQDTIDCMASTFRDALAMFRFKLGEIKENNEDEAEA